MQAGLFFVLFFRVLLKYMRNKQASPWPYPQVFAHRGAGTHAPENTLAAMRNGYARGYRAVEFDVMLSKDSVPILMHDPAFGRTILGTGQVNEFSAQQMALMDAGGWHSPAFRGEPVPSFDDVARYCAQHAVAMNIEIKPSPGAEHETGHIVAQSLGQLRLQLPALNTPTLEPLVSSFSTEALAAFRSIDKKTSCGHLFDRIPADWKNILVSLDCQALHCNWKHLSPQMANAIKSAAYWLFCYTINDPIKAADLIQLGVDGFCTDRLDLFDPAKAISASGASLPS